MSTRDLFFPRLRRWGLLVMAPLAALPALHSQPAEAIEATNISSNHLEMQGTVDRNYFYFAGKVHVKGTNLDIQCDELTVVAMREGPEGATIGNIGAIEKIVANGSVEIHQAGRSAYAGKAEVNPHAGTVTLIDNPRIVDDEVEVQGYMFVLHKGERKFESIPDPNAPPEAPSRSVVRLGAMPNLGFDQKQEEITVDDKIDVPTEAEGVQEEESNQTESEDNERPPSS